MNIKNISGERMYVMKKIVQKYRLHYFGTIVFSVVASVFLSLFSIKLGAVIDVVLRPEQGLFSRILTCIALIFTWFLFSMMFGYMKVKYSYHILRELKYSLYSALYRRNIGEFMAEPSEDYLNIMTKDMDLLNENYLQPKCDIVSNVISAVVSIISIFIIEWKLGIAFVLVSLVTIVFSQLPGVLMAKKTTEYSDHSAVYLGKVANFLKGFEQIKLLSLSSLFLDKFDTADQSFEKTRKNYLFTQTAADRLGMFFSFFAQLLCLSVGIWFVLHDQLTVGLLISAINLLNGVFSPLQSFVQNKNLMKTVDNITNKMDAILNKERKQQAGLNETVSTMALEDVCLNFTDGKTVFDNYSIQFEKNKKYAIIGDSGKGKSTMIKMFLKYFSQQDFKGQVRINGKNIEEMDADSIYRRIGFIQKNDFLIDGTVKDNIALFRKNEKLYGNDFADICQELNFSDSFLKKTIELTNRQQISTGEKQRIDLARFWLNDYDVLVFDEPTSNLDPKMSNAVYDLILGIQNKLVIVITHDREETLLKRFDEVVSI